MTEEAFEAALVRAERQSQDSPGLYNAQVIGMLSLGYAALLGALVGLAAAMLAVVLMVVFGPGRVLLVKVGAKAAFVILPVFGAFLSALFLRLPPPDGVRITRRDAPELFAMIDALRTETGAGRIHHVLLTAEPNAAIAEHSRFVSWPFYRNYLILGLPFLDLLDPDEFKAVVAHELGHLSNRHGRLSSWSYRSVRAWSHVAEALEFQGAVAGPIRGFMGWYLPRLSALTFAVRRANEYQADAASAQVVGAEATARALVRTEILGTHLGERYWPRLHQRVVWQSNPPTDAGTGQVAVARSLDAARAHELLDRARTEQSHTGDTHPALSERVEALGQAVAMPPPVGTTAAEAFLGPHRDALAAAVDEHWHDDRLEHWYHMHLELQPQRDRLLELEKATDLDLDRTLQLVDLTRDFRGDEAAEPVARVAVERFPASALAWYRLGTLPIDTDDAIGALRRCLDLEPEAIAAVGPRLAVLLHAAGRADEARELMGQAFAGMQRQQDIADERNAGFDRTTEVVGHGLDDAALAPFVAVVRRALVFEEVWLVQKAETVGGEPLFAIVVRSDEPEAASEWVDELFAAVPGAAWIYDLSVEGWWKAKLADLDGAAIRWR